jgi:hypothetical protein
VTFTYASRRRRTEPLRERLARRVSYALMIATCAGVGVAIAYGPSALG